MARKRSLPIILALVSLLAVAGGRKPKAVVSFHLEETETQAGKFVIPIKLGNPPRTYYFRKVPEITHRKIDGYYKFPAENGAGWGVAFHLNRQGRNTLETITNASRGKRLLTAVAQRPVNFVLIDKAIDHGYIVVWSGLTNDDIEKIDKVINRIKSPGEGDREMKGFEEPVYELETPSKKPKRRGLFGRRKKSTDSSDPPPPSEPAENPADDFAPLSR